MSHLTRPSLSPAARVLAATVMLGGGLLLPLALAGPAAAVTPRQSALVNGELRLDGRAFAGAFVIARSTTSSAGARADENGAYHIRATGFTAPDCLVTISDTRTADATDTLDGCVVSIDPVPTSPAPPTGACVITPAAPALREVGVSTVVNVQATGCDTTTGSGATPTPVQWSVVAGSIPTGMVGPFSQGTTGANIIGTPSVPGTYRFTLEVTDQVGATDQETFTVTIG